MGIDIEHIEGSYKRPESFVAKGDGRTEWIRVEWENGIPENLKSLLEMDKET